MALRDVKAYYVDLLGQVVEMRKNLNDFEEAFKAGNITEDRLAEIKTMTESIESNFERVAYILYLFELPNRNDKKEKLKKQKRTELIEQYFDSKNASEEAVIDENKSTIDRIKNELKKIEEEIKEQKA